MDEPETSRVLWVNAGGAILWPRTRHFNQLRTFREKIVKKDRESREWLDVKALRMWTRVLRVDAGGAIPWNLVEPHRSSSRGGTTNPQ